MGNWGPAKVGLIPKWWTTGGRAGCSESSFSVKGRKVLNLIVSPTFKSSEWELSNSKNSGQATDLTPREIFAAIIFGKVRDTKYLLISMPVIGRWARGRRGCVGMG
ncbi:unnamed protein product [Meloidogyne enterolobii]|uniref:Uncharacterized protein n=1 Tax=Meloidogyne enterolobii TaxID=390850 RepID=A0ACB1AED7_MELEN